MNDNPLAQIIASWMLVAGVIVLVRWRRDTPTSGLVLAYVYNLWLIHCFPAIIYLLPWYQSGDARLTHAGAAQSLWGIAGFAFGSLILAPFLKHSGLLPAELERQEPDRRLPLAYVLLGACFYFLLNTAIGSLPSATAIISTGQQLIVVGVGLCCWQAWKEGNKQRLALWILAAFTLPLVTILTRGFIGYGATATASVLIFLSSFVRSRTRVAAAAFVLSFVGLSVYVTYMRDRTDIRASVWGGQSSFDRVGRLTETALTFEWFDPANNDHLERIDGRLNQDILVGASVEWLSQSGGFANGETLWDSFFAIIPRAVWRDKPMTAGSGGLVTQYTGIQFDAATSVGIGQVMEFYVNFGTLGVIIGFVLIGTLITLLDTAASERLANGNIHGFVIWYLPGISLLQVGGSMVEITSSCVASLFTAALANRYLSRLQRKRSVAIMSANPTHATSTGSVSIL